MKKGYSNPVRKPKKYIPRINIQGGGASPESLSYIQGRMVLPLSDDFSAMFGGSESQQKFKRETFYSHIDQHLKQRFREAGIKFKNFKVNYKQQSGKTDWKVESKHGPWTRSGTSKSDIGRSLVLSLSDVKLNDRGSLTMDINLGIKKGHIPVGQDGMFTRDPMFKNIHDEYRQVGPGPKHENVGTVGFKYKW